MTEFILGGLAGIAGLLILGAILAKHKRVTDPLKPGFCECGHLRCYHKDGSLKCTVAYPASDKWPLGAVCACEVFIYDPDGGDDDDGNDDETPDTPIDPELAELRKMMGIK